MNLTAFRNIEELLSLLGARGKGGRHITESDLGVIKKAALIVGKGKVVWVGKDKSIPRSLKGKIAREVSLKGKTVIPGLVDCHTHLVFAGDRSNEFELRNKGVSYQEIASKGGGILSTMQATRKASVAELIKLAQLRMNGALAQGITTLEIKSGYSLNEKDEIKQLHVIQNLKGPRAISTFLGAHALPPEFSDRKEYLKFLSKKVLPIIAKKKLAQRVDIFVESGFFESSEAREYLEECKRLGFDITIHADQLSLSGGTSLAIDLAAKSADHVIQIGESEVSRIAASQTTAVLLPAADLYMKCNYPPARKLIEAGARVALATDFNPGSCPTQDINLVGILARLYMGMSLPEVISSLTVGGAYALGLENEVGCLSQGFAADFIVTNQNWRTLFYSSGVAFVDEVFIGGKKRPILAPK